jgi:hypothetical protein
MILSLLLAGLMATLPSKIYAKKSHHHHVSSHHPHAEFRSLQDTNTTGYHPEVAGISLMDSDTKIPDVSSDNIFLIANLMPRIRRVSLFDHVDCSDPQRCCLRSYRLSIVGRRSLHRRLL